MDEVKKKKNSKKSPFRALNEIDRTLSAAYRPPKAYQFSDDKDYAIVQKAVLYHRLRENPALRAGLENAENDAAYDRLASSILAETDPLAKYIRGKKGPEQADLLKELMDSDESKAWFEDMLETSEEKKAEVASLGGDNTLPSRLKAESSRAQGTLLGGLVDARQVRPRDFLAKPENYAAARRMLAVELHRRQTELELAELQEANQYESPENQRMLIATREAFSFEENASKDLEAYLKQLEASQEVTAMLYRMTQLNEIEELGKAVKNPVFPTISRLHENLALTEQKLIPDAVNAFLTSPGAPKADTFIHRLLRELTDPKKNIFPVRPTPEECEKRIQEYEKALKAFGETDYSRSAPGMELKKILDDQIERLKDAALSPARESIKLTFHADTLIDYVDTSDPRQRPMDAIEAREKLIRGAVLEQNTFADGEFMGTSQTVTYDKKTGLIKRGPEKFITRVLDLSGKTEKKPQLQLEELRKIKDVLKQSDPFYVKNSEEFAGVMNSLNKVIKAQESLDKEANIRQVASLRALYSELDTNIGKYVKEKGERMKTGDVRGQFRTDVLKTLKSITGDKHVKNMTNQLYDEQKKLDAQLHIAKPCQEIMNKWKKAGTPTTPEQYAEYKKDFQALSSRFDMVEKSFDDLSYYKMSIATGLEQYTKQAEEVQQKLGPEEKLNDLSLQHMKDLAAESNTALKGYYAMDPLFPEQKKEAKKERVISPVKSTT